MDPELAGAFLYGAIFGTALAHRAVVMVNRSLPAVTTSLGLLATPLWAWRFRLFSSVSRSAFP